MAKMDKIGVWNTAFLGDAVLTLPLLQALRAVCPGAAIDFWVRKGFAPLFAAHPAVSHVHEYDKRGKDRGLFHAMRFVRFPDRERYDLWICAHTSLRSALIARLSRAPMRIGYAKPASGAWLHTHTAPRRFSELEEIERLLQLLAPLGPAFRDTPFSVWPDIVLPKFARDAAEAFRAKHTENGKRPVLGVHPGSIWGTKRWPPEYFAAIAANAAREGAHVLVFGGPGEEDIAGEVAARARNALSPAASAFVRDLSGTLSLAELAAYIGRLDAYLTNDSGPMHLAWPQRIPVTALFGPTTRELGFFPRGEGAMVMELPLPCRPCGLHGPRVCPLGHHRCMRDMTPDIVWPDVAAKIFKKNDTPVFQKSCIVSP